MVWRNVFYVTLIGILFVILGLSLLFLLDFRFNWNLDIKTTHSGFFQAWIYILQTIALVGTLGYIGLQTSAAEKAVRSNTVQLMVAAHRDLLSKVIEKPELFEVLKQEDVPSDPASQIFLTMLLNHGFNAFMLRQNSYIDDDWWNAITNDMKDIIRKPAMRKWWERQKTFYSLQYQSFIDQQILK